MLALPCLERRRTLPAFLSGSCLECGDRLVTRQGTSPEREQDELFLVLNFLSTTAVFNKDTATLKQPELCLPSGAERKAWEIRGKSDVGSSKGQERRAVS